MDPYWNFCSGEVIQEFFFLDRSCFFLRGKFAMSRCFSFPPPGYERKHRPEDLDLLKEVKSKEKKHKKDKGRKKEKGKEKDRSAEKHRDKKDRKGKKHKDKKEKHRNKKDKEGRGKDKEKSSISEESTVARNEEISETKLYSHQNRSHFVGEGKCSALLQDRNGGKSSQNSLPSQGNEESKFVQELGRRIRDQKSRGSQLPERVAVADKMDLQLKAREAIRNSAVLTEQKGDNKNKVVDEIMGPQDFRNTMVQNLMPIVKGKGEGIPRPVNEENGWRLEYKEKFKGIVGNQQKDESKESHKKEKKDDKMKLKSENKECEQDKLKDDGRNNLGGVASNRSADMLKDANSNAINEGNIKKRKDMDINGFLHESEIRPSKVQRPAAHQSTENGRKFEPFRTPIKSSNDKHTAVPNNVRADIKDQLINGVFEAQKPSPSKPNDPPMVSNQIVEASKLPQRDSNDFKVSKMEDPIAEVSRRPPHPDSKYLAEVLTVPMNLADWSQNDHQDWLFSEKVVLHPREPTLESSWDIKEDVRVWSEAVHIESADVCALPYVIPY